MLIVRLFFLFFFLWLVTCFVLCCFQWMPVDEVLKQPFYREDHMSKRIVEICMATHERDYCGFIAHKLTSKIDGNLSYLYYYNEKSTI